MLDVLNRYAHGVVAIPVLIALRDGGLFRELERAGPSDMAEIRQRLSANGGHLAVALRLLQSLRWLETTPDGRLALTGEAARLDAVPGALVELLDIPMAPYLTGATRAGRLDPWIARCRERWGIGSDVLADFMDGLLVIPVLLGLRHTAGQRGAPETAQAGQPLDALFTGVGDAARDELRALFLAKAWARSEDEGLVLTDVGQFMVERIPITAAMAAYTPMLRRARELLFGDDPRRVFVRDETGRERHLDRALNVAGSGFQHDKFFRDVEDVVVRIFDRLPLEAQPRYVADMGSGDGSLLRRIFDTVRDRTRRGPALSELPLTMIGVDFNTEALEATARTLGPIPHLVLRGDVSDPERLVEELRAHRIDPDDVLHVRSFLDHDRAWVPPADAAAAARRERLPYGGVYVDAGGAAIPSALVVQSLVEHFARWAPLAAKHGLVLLEVHSLDPETVARFLDESESLHFDAYHGFSQQYPVDAETLLVSLAEAGLFPRRGFARRYPRALPFTRITMNWLEQRPYRLRHPVAEDLPELLVLEAACWPEPLRAPAAELLDRMRRCPTGQWVVERDRRIVAAAYSQRIAGIDALRGARHADVSRLHRDDGPVVQLLGLNVRPEAQDQGLGDELLDVVLQLVSVKPGVEGAVGVTRCRDYREHPALAMVEYVGRHDEHGHAVDPVLRFHRAHGAKIVAVLDGYRPEDTDNRGHGVLIAYDVMGLVGVPAGSREPEPAGSDPGAGRVDSPRDGVLEVVSAAIRGVLGEHRAGAFAPSVALRDLGCDSLDLLELRHLLTRRLGVEFDSTVFFRYRNAEALAGYLDERRRPGAGAPSTRAHPARTSSRAVPADRAASVASVAAGPGGAEPIAIVGLACRFPGADGPAAYWALLRDGVDGVGDVPASRWPVDQYYRGGEIRPGAMATRRGGFLARVDEFDAAFFHIAPREANGMDPQQRLLLECAWHALEHAGGDPSRLAARSVGVFVGLASHDYEILQLKPGRPSTCDAYFGSGVSGAVAAGRIAYFFDFRGPALTIDTACSSSLVAVHLACRSLRTGECELALAAGVNLMLSPELTITFSQAGMLAPDGRCKTLDASADGYVRSEGCAVVVLKRLSRALADGDRIVAVLRGTAVNQDGASNGLTAPNGFAQQAVIRQALADAGVEPAAVSYTELHGTGTPLGDPVEVQALEQVFGGALPRTEPLAVGSVKTNIGHTEAVAGLAGLIKVVLALEHEWIPPHLHFRALNPEIRLDRVPFAIPTAGMPWPRRDAGRPRLAGVSAFGFSGTNAHVVVEEAPRPVTRPPAGDERPRHLLALSAASETALRSLATAYADYLDHHPDDEPADVAFTANTGRAHLAHRVTVAGATRAQLGKQLAHFARSGGDHPRERDVRRVAFLFTGQGSQYVGMAAELCRTQPSFRRSLERCDEILRPVLGRSLFDLLDPDAAEAGLLHETAFTQPVLFALEWALAELWRSWGVLPAALLGHSVGEYVAACLADVFSVEDGLRLVARRGQLMQALPRGGAMVAVLAEPERVAAALVPFAADASIAAVNGPESVVISGAEAAVAAVAAALGREGARTTHLAVSHAFHSPLMVPMLDAFRDAARGVEYRPPAVDLVSNLSGARAGAEIASADYWVAHVREPVQFGRGMAALRALGCDAYLEIGPKPILLAMGRQCVPSDDAAWLPSLREGRSDWDTLLESLGALYRRGASIDWAAFDRPYARRKLTLPPYPFERRRFWTDPVVTDDRAAVTEHRSVRASDAPGHHGHPLLGPRLRLAESSNAPVWSRVLDGVDPAYVEDHRIEGAIVYPATAYLEMATAAAAHALRTDDLEVRHLAFETPLVLHTGEAIELQTHLSSTDGGDGTVSVHSRARDAGDADGWVRHCVAVVRRRAPASALESSPAETPAQMAAHCPEEIRAADFYASWARRGNQWGSAFQRITGLWRGDRQALARIEIPEVIGATLAGYRAHPAVLDACLQALAAAVPAAVGGTFVGKSVDACRVLAPLRGPVLWSHATVRTGGPTSREITGDVEIVDAGGVLVAELRGVRFAFLDLAAPEGVEPDRWLYHVRWSPIDRGPAPASASPATGVFLLLDDEDADAPLRHALEHALEGRGRRVVSLESALSSGAGALVMLAGGRRSTTDTTSTLSWLRRRLNDVLACIRALAARAPAPVPPLFVVTRGAWALPGDAGGTSPFDASVWGLGRTLAVEHRELWGGLIDLPPSGEPETLAAALADALLHGGGENELAVRGGRLLVPRLVPLNRAFAGEAVRLRTDGSYLITGGLGKLGLRIARWMIARGCRRLILMGRSGLPPRSRWLALEPSSLEGRRVAAIRELEALGADVRIARVDVADEPALRAWIDAYRVEAWPPIRGVLHLAGTLEPAAAAAVTEDSLVAHLGPKVAGAAALDAIFAGDELDCFVLFSSASTVLGSPGLAAYAAANTFLDALAMERRARGLPAQSIAWGAWAEGGMAADLPAGRYRVLHPIDPERGIALMDRVWNAEVASVGVLPIDWVTWRERYATVAAVPLLSELLSGATASPEPPGARLDPVRLRPLDPDVRRALLTERLVGHVARVLRLAPESIEPRQRLSALGLDSLMALEVRNRVQADMGLSIPLVEIIRGASVEALVIRLDERVVSGEAVAGVTATPLTELAGRTWPCSHGQRAQWLIHALDPESPAYHVAFTARIRSGVDLAALRRAWQALRDRHPSLRTTWAAVGEELLQRIHARLPDGFETVDAAALDDVTLRPLVERAYRRPFDLAHGPVARLHVFSRAEEEHVLLLVAHHIACDGGSLWILLEELKTLYAAARRGETPPSPAPGASYVDYVRWQQALLDGPEGERLWEYWRRQLTGELPVVDLPVDRPRPPVPSRRGASHDVEISGGLARRLRALAHARGTTLFTVLATAVNVLLHRYGGQEDIVLGATTTGRTRSEFAGTVGHFVNQVVLRGDLSGDPTFQTLLDRMRETVLGAVAHQDLPFSLLVQRLGPARDPGLSPLFQVNFVFQQVQQSGEILDLMVETGGSALDWGGLRLEGYPLHQQEGQFDLTVEIFEAGERLAGRFKYNPDLFDASTMTRIAGHLHTLLAAIAKDPGRRISELDLVTPAERRQQLHEWNASEPVRPSLPCLHELFVGQATRAPDAVALVSEGERVSYGELNRRANRLAHRLRRLGVSVETLVAILLEPSVDTVVAVLAVLKAGGAYLPLDASAPRDRLAFMLEDSGAAVVVTRGPMRERLPEWPGPILSLDTDGEALGREPDDTPSSPALAGHAAYCIYTSGTTGRPKGVLVTHGNVTRLLEATDRWFQFGPADTWTLFHSSAFDFSVWEIWGALLHGGRLVIVPTWVTRAPEAFVALMVREAVTVLNHTPSAFRELIRADAGAAPDALASLRLVVFGGEALDPRMLAPWFERHGTRTPRLINMYGITETTVHVTYSPVEDDRDGPSCIGRPIPDLQVYVLDGHLEPVPVGVRGELYVGGAGLSRGYLGRPELTAERFVPHPWSAEPGARMYRTGDLGRFRTDGRIEYLGRIDRQVKVRGFRIERGEIEAVLREHPEVSDAVVVPREGVGGTTLVAYAVRAGGGTPSADELRRHLRRRLPDYMVPSALVVLDGLPLTPNGKLDDRALPPADGSRAQSALATPRTETERVVASVWRQVLAIEAIGVHDNFFDLGGHSLLVPRVHRALQERFDRELSIVELFRYPTVHELAGYLAGHGATAETAERHESRADLRRSRRSGAARGSRIPDGSPDRSDA